MSVRHLIFVLAICIIPFLLPYHCAGQAEEEGKRCPKPYIKTITPWAAKPGYLVKIQGEKFGLERGEVIFTEEVSLPLQRIISPGVKAEIRNWTLHRIWVIVPQSATSGPVFERARCGSESNKKDFRVIK
jgi:hypothetical protein